MLINDNTQQESICIRFAGMDQQSGAIFLQFSIPEKIATLEQSTIHAFFPHEHEYSSVDDLLPHMAAMGTSILAQQQEVEFKNKLGEQQAAAFSKLIGTHKIIETSTIASILPAMQTSHAHVIEDTGSPNAQVDQFRCIVLEILAEEGLIPGAVK